MNRALVVLSSFLLVSGFTLAAANPSSDPVAATASKPRVTVLVSATEKSGAPAKQLAKESISVLDNGESAEVLDFREASPVPLQLAIVLAASKAGFAQEQAAAIDLVRKMIRPNIDRAFVITAGGTKAWTNSQINWLSDPDALEKSIKSLDKSTGLGDAFYFDIESLGAGNARGGTIQTYAAVGENNVFNIVWRMMQVDPRPARRAVVIFRDPWKHSNGFHDSFSREVGYRINKIVAEAQQLRASFFVVALEDSAPNAAAAELGAIYQPTFSGEGGANRVYDQEIQKARERAYASGRANLERLSAETGGGIWFGGKKNFSDVVEAISKQLAGQYVLTFMPRLGAPAPQHTLKVEAKGTDVRINAPKAFWIPVQQPAAAPPAK